MLINLTGDELLRHEAIAALKAPDESRDDVLEKFVMLAGKALNIPGSFISVIDDRHQYVRAAHNFDLRQSLREDSFCRYVVDNSEAIVVSDTYLDDRFSSNPLTRGAPYIRFYAGVPLQNREGIILGTLCVTDTTPHVFPEEKLQTLKLLASLVMSFLEIWHSAGFTDAATGLPNRQRIIRELQLLQTDEISDAYCLVIIDCVAIQRLYELARSMGMAPVESLLKAMASLLRERLNMSTEQLLYTVAVGRYAILAPTHQSMTAAQISARLEGASATLEGGVSVRLEVHTGEVCFTPSEYSAQEILRRALSALHEAINLKVPSCKFDETTDAQRNSDFRLMNELATALQDIQGLYLVYQPKVCLLTNQPVGLEALIRWRHPDRGELSPCHFLPLAEQTNLMAALTDWVVDDAIRQMKIWTGTPFALPVSINVSASDVSRKGFAESLERKMREANLAAKMLGIECLETEEITEDTDALSGLNRLKQFGFVISLDDFGAGYSNINYLRRMPLDTIKLDRALITALLTDMDSQIIVNSTIQMLKNLKYTVVAEGVENAETVAILQDYGCDQVQGFFYSRPLEPAALEKWLTIRRT
ncbi:sensor domain-containing diguanylate cyclase [Ewingella americana]|jgi:EAL domain-containing protein (putative c-di-GMP-specific phosphodiesterase class I)/GGDEF domain-containing protein|uniref:Sensor domain-containing phosphodiesterase n=1 Tax=Ewingella americana TaxID=41202 RepID=A0A502GSK9_9GAMM|nr:sensor domain-containing phosphodiesterase [Ewingella americana]TPG64911.1 sensor domain-containing phosphodiesterase [Ewingella americana]